MTDENPLYPMIRAGVPAGFLQLHIVGFAFPAEIPEADIDELMQECRDLQHTCGGRGAGILSWLVTKNIDPRKGYGWVEVGVFEDADAFVNFHAHPDHKLFGAKVAAFAEGATKWVVLDVPIGQDSLVSLLSAVTGQSLVV